MGVEDCCGGFFKAGRCACVCVPASSAAARHLLRSRGSDLARPRCSPTRSARREDAAVEDASVDGGGAQCATRTPAPAVCFDFEGVKGWFRCPCHGSTYTKAGIRVFGPAPRSMDTMKIDVDGAGNIVVQTGVRQLGGPDNPKRAIQPPGLPS